MEKRTSRRIQRPRSQPTRTSFARRSACSEGTPVIHASGSAASASAAISAHCSAPFFLRARRCISASSANSAVSPASIEPLTSKRPIIASGSTMAATVVSAPMAIEEVVRSFMGATSWIAAYLQVHPVAGSQSASFPVHFLMHSACLVLRQAPACAHDVLPQASMRISAGLGRS